MPSIQKLFTLEVSPERFLECCSGTELIEVDMLLNSERFKRRMKGNIDRCLTEDWGCVYHACMSNDCQKSCMIENGFEEAKGNCEQVQTETLYDKQVRENKERGRKFECPPIFREGILKYQMTCDDCPAHIKVLCEKSSKNG